MPFLDEVRCVAYLFSKDFRVYDSLQDIHVDVYWNTEWVWMGKQHYEGISHKIYLMAYKIAMEENIEFFKNRFRDFVVSVYDLEGRLLNIRYFNIGPGSIMPASLYNIDAVCSSLRIPTSWSVVKDGMEFIFWCADEQEQSVFSAVLYRSLKKLGFMNKQLSKWRVFFLSCLGKTQDQFLLSEENE